MKNSSTTTCEECDSLYFSDSSRMSSMCPECAHIIYGYKACVHDFVDGRCKDFKRDRL
jgi:hypothetical protein